MVGYSKFLLLGAIAFIFCLAMTSAAWTAALGTNLTAYWDFEESSGLLIDKLDGDNNGTVQGATRQSDGIVGDVT